MTRDPRRDACDELAERLATPEGLRTARLLELNNILAPTATSPPGSPASQPSASQPPDSQPPADRPRPISIWQPVGGTTADDPLRFRRPRPHPLGDHYAQRREIAARKPQAVQRICFFGESVAAGYLLAPHLTPAGELQRQLHGAAPDAFEVVDLARTNETLGTMVTTLERSLQLAPDVWVLFTGNNWNLLETPDVSPYVPAVASRQRVALALRRHGGDGPRELARRDLQHKVVRSFQTIAAMAREHGISVIQVIPEVNLADWEDRQPVPWLAGDGCNRWYETLELALRSIAVGDFAEVLGLADTLLALDHGACPTTHRLRARAFAGLGRFEEARAAAEAEVEAGRYATQAFLGAPRISASEQALLRSQAELHGFARIDLPTLFAEATGSRYPGRRLFLDYCHLTVEGTALAMRGVADAILRQHKAQPQELTISEPPLADAARAVAQFGAAIHSAHRLLTVDASNDHLVDWCRQALSRDPEIATTMRWLLAARCAPCPEVLTPAQQHQSQQPHPLLLQHGWRWDHLDVSLLGAICAALDAAEPALGTGEPTSASARELLHQLLLEEYAVGSEPVDLSRPPYLWQPLERFYPEAMAPRGMTGRAALRAAWPQSSFCLIADGTADIELDLTCRLPPIAGSGRRGEMALRINDRKVAEQQIEERWSRWRLTIPSHQLTSGLNGLTVIWPRLPATGEAALADCVARLEQGVETDLHPVFGELFSLRARRL